MKYVNDLLSKLNEKQKNMVLNIRPDFQITLYDYITTVLIKHVDATGCVTVNGILLFSLQKISHLIN